MTLGLEVHILGWGLYCHMAKMYLTLKIFIFTLFTVFLSKTKLMLCYKAVYLFCEIHDPKDKGSGPGVGLI